MAKAVGKEGGAEWVPPHRWGRACDGRWEDEEEEGDKWAGVAGLLPCWGRRQSDFRGHLLP